MSDPRLASTVILLRDTASGLEVLLMERHKKSGFAGGAYVFPGGSVDVEDQVEERCCAGLDDAAACRTLRLQSGGLAHYVAVVRECFEEAGVLLAYAPDGELLDFRPADAEERYRTLRQALHKRQTSLEAIAEQGRLKLATDQIHYWAHWITPLGQPIRFDTRFFLAVAPANQTAVHDDWELTASAWITPQEALAKADRKEWRIILPTRHNLLSLCEFRHAQEAIETARRRVDFPVMQPRVFEDAEGVRLVLPGDEGYEEAERDTSKFDRSVFERSQDRRPRESA